MLGLFERAIVFSFILMKLTWNRWNVSWLEILKPNFMRRLGCLNIRLVIQWALQWVMVHMLSRQIQFGVTHTDWQVEVNYLNFSLQFSHLYYLFSLRETSELNTYNSTKKTSPVESGWLINISDGKKENLGTEWISTELMAVLLMTIINHARMKRKTCSCHAHVSTSLKHRWNKAWKILCWCCCRSRMAAVIVRLSACSVVWY